MACILAGFGLYSKHDMHDFAWFTRQWAKHLGTDFGKALGSSADFHR
jgi:hypothetical protein